MLHSGSARLQGVYVGSDFRSHCSPVSSGGVANRLNVLFHLFGRLRCSSTGLLFACLDFFMRLFLGSGDCVFRILGADRQIGQLLGESLNHVFSSLSARRREAPIVQPALIVQLRVSPTRPVTARSEQLGKQAAEAPALQVTLQKNRGSARQDPSGPTLGSQRRLERRRCCGRIGGRPFATYEVPLALF